MNKKTDEKSNIKNKIINILKNFILTVKYLIFKFLKKFLKKDITSLEYTKEITKNVKTKSMIAIIYSVISIILIFIMLKIVLVEKNNYNPYDNYTYNYTEKTNSNDNNEKNQITNQNQNIERVSSTAMEEELEAQYSFKKTLFSFNVKRKITTKEKIHLFNTANWSDINIILPENTKLNADLMVSPGGYMMYQIADGDYKGKFISANNKLIDVEIEDSIKTDIIKKNTAIKILNNINSYKDKELKKIKAQIFKNVVLNIKGYGIYNNRLVYLVTNGTFIPMNPEIIIETTREEIKEKEKNKNNTKNKKTKNR